MSRQAHVLLLQRTAPVLHAVLWSQGDVNVPKIAAWMSYHEQEQATLQEAIWIQTPDSKAAGCFSHCTATSLTTNATPCLRTYVRRPSQTHQTHARAHQTHAPAATSPNSWNGMWALLWAVASRHAISILERAPAERQRSCYRPASGLAAPACCRTTVKAACTWSHLSQQSR